MQLSKEKELVEAVQRLGPETVLKTNSPTLVEENKTPMKVGEILEKVDKRKMKIDKALRLIKVHDYHIEAKARVKTHEPESIVVNQHGDIEKRYRLQNGKTMLSTEQPHQNTGFKMCVRNLV